MSNYEDDDHGRVGQRCKDGQLDVGMMTFIDYLLHAEWCLSLILACRVKWVVYPIVGSTEGLATNEVASPGRESLILLLHVQLGREREREGNEEIEVER